MVTYWGAVFAILCLLGFLGLGVCSFFAFIEGIDERRVLPFALGSAGGLIMVLIVAAAVVQLDGQNSDRLCQRGHQEWRTTQRAPVLAGKVIVPGGSSTSKVWVCEQWETP